MKYLQVVLFGDSLAWSPFVPYGARYADFLEAALQDAIGEERVVDVAACGEGGNTVEEGFARIERDCIDYAPDVIAVNFGGNDAVRSLNRDRFRAFYRRLVGALKKGTRAALILETPPALDEERHACRSIPQAVLHGGLEKYVEYFSHAFIRDLAKTEGFVLHDRFAIYHEAVAKDSALRDRLILSDGAHFTVEGNRFFAQSLAGVILPLIVQAHDTGIGAERWYERAILNAVFMEFREVLENGRLAARFANLRGMERLMLQQSRSFSRRASVIADDPAVASKARVAERLAAGFLAAERAAGASGAPDVVAGSIAWGLNLLRGVDSHPLARKLSDFLIELRDRAPGPEAPSA